MTPVAAGAQRVARFDGEICGFGTASGTRIVVGRWMSSPFGAFVDVMVERRDGRRVLLAPTDAVAEYVAGVYEFDEVLVVGVDTRRDAARLRVAAGPLCAEVGIGRRDALGWVLRAVPRRLARQIWWTGVTDHVARRLVAGVRTHGRTPGGSEYYAALDRHRLTGGRASWDGLDLGSLGAVVPPVRFGFGSTPSTPSIVRLTSIVVPERSDG